KTFAAKYNAVFEDIYASKSTNKNAAFRAFLQGNLSLLRNELEATNEEFLNAVMEYRALKGSERTIEHTLSGAMFDAKTARRRGLVDGIGGMDYAIKRLMAAVAQRKN
ncbi:MAG: S49 family peptidase, partial [Lewinella sp.]|nr:S49 family peptidase [Lewinella sp.]